VNRNSNKKESIEYIVEINIFYKGHTERTEIDVVREKKWSVISEMSWLAYYNPEID